MSARDMEVRMRFAHGISAQGFLRRFVTTVPLAALLATPLAAEVPDVFVYDFTGLGSDGSTPIAPVVLDASGFLYGTTQSGGSNTGGIVFKVKTDGSGYSVLHQFPSTATEGYGPAAGL